MSAPHLSRRLFAVIVPLIMLMAVIGYVSWQNSKSSAFGTSASSAQTGAAALQKKSQQPPRLEPASTDSVQPVKVADDAATVPAFRLWLDQYRVADEASRSALLPQGKELAAQRRVRMARLIRQNPEQALAESLRLHEYAALPEDVKPLVERPFSETASYHYYPVCGSIIGSADHIAQVNLTSGGLDAYTFGRRTSLMSKHAVPVQGIALDDAAALHETAMRPLEPAEIAIAKEMFPSGQTDLTRSFVTGEKLTAEPVVALAGGQIYHLADQVELARLNDAITEVENMPGPHAGSDVLHQAAPVREDEGFNFAAAQESGLIAASTWTETVKRVFVIRVDFSDQQGAPFTQAATVGNLNGAVSDQIRAMSYGKTWITAGVSANVYRMPQPTSFYVNGTTGNSLNDEMLRDARNTFRTTKSGADAAINIGAVNNTGTGAGSGLGDYDIVGVVFGSLGMRAGIVYGGLAGGGDLWMQGTIGVSIFTHEFGHNYGVLHSSFWQTSDGSVTGTGSSVEYGDDFDIMGGGSAPEGHFNPQAKARLDWLAPAEWSDATAHGSATYRIHRIDDQFTTGSPRGVRITRNATAGAQEYFWLGYRPAYSGIPYLTRGAYLQWQRPNQIYSWLVDTTPATSGVKTDAPIALGRTFADATSNAFITPVAVGGGGVNSYLDVRVNFGPFPGNASPIAGAISGPSTVPARSNATFSISASDANGDTLAYNWDTGDGSVPDNASSMIQNWTVGGTYTLSLTVSDMKGGTTTVTKNVTVTDPLDTWTAGSVGGSYYLEPLLYAEGRFITADYWGTIFLSWDGTSWINAGLPPDLIQARLAYGGSTFVAAGVKGTATTSGQICWSPDGRRWNLATFPNGIPAIKGVAYGNGLFTAVGEDGLVLTSTDGKTWSSGIVSGAPDFRHVAWSGSAWVALSVNPTGGMTEVVWTSPNAATWTQRDNLGADMSRLRNFAGRLYTVGWYAGLRYSTDSGLTWQSATLPAGTRWTTHDIAMASDGTFVCAARAMDESGSPGAQLISSDGLRWVRATGNADMAFNAKSLFYGAGKFLTVEYGGGVRRSNALFPTNNAPSASFSSAPPTGSARQTISLTASATDSDGDPLTYAWDFGSQLDVQDGTQSVIFFPFGGSYTVTLRVSDGRGGISTLNHNITITDPARTFTNRSTSTTGHYTALAAGGGRVVAVGQASDGTNSYQGPFAWSTNGSTWTTGSFAGNEHMYAVTHDGAQFIAVGMMYDFTAPAQWKGRITTSPDGATWTQRYWAGNKLASVAYGNGVYVAAGDLGAFARSTNGTSWTTHSIPGFSAFVLEGLSFNGSVFLITGYTPGAYASFNGGARAFTSTDGLNWVDQTMGIGTENWQDIRKNAWLNDRFIASGFYSKLRVSTNSGASFTTTRTNTEDIQGFAYGAGVYFTAGTDRSNSDADVDVLSLDGTNWYSYPAPTGTDRSAAIFFNSTFITAGRSGSIWQSGTISNSTAAYASWYARNFPGSGPSSLSASDPDGDGLNNNAEYALDLNPDKVNGAVTEGMTQIGRGWIKLSLPEPARPDVRYVIQGTNNLTGTWTVIARKEGTGAWTWLGGGTSRINVGTPSNGRNTVEVGTPDGQAGNYFIRLSLESL